VTTRLAVPQVLVAVEPGDSIASSRRTATATRWAARSGASPFVALLTLPAVAAGGGAPAASTSVWAWGTSMSRTTTCGALQTGDRL
jgi:hypothetical protein